MTKSVLAAIVALGLSVAGQTYAANPAIIVAAPINDLGFQEYDAAKWFTTTYPEGVVLQASEVTTLDPAEISCVWIHIDRCAVGKGNLPSSFTATTFQALTDYVNAGGCLYLSKQATQLLSKIGRIDAKFDPNIYGDGEGGMGSDNWNLNAYFGYWQKNPDNQGDKFPDQIYDRTGHKIYEDMTTNSDFPWPTFPMLGTGDPTTSLWREDHNCMWDLNAYTYTAKGANTVEKFEADNNCQIIGTWGHVQDYAVAGVIEFYPATATAGTIIANGLAAYEWSPRQGTNAFHSNITLLTANTINYLSKQSSAAIDIEAPAANAPVRYFNLQGIEVDGSNLTPGIYIRLQGNKTTKFLVK